MLIGHTMLIKANRFDINQNVKIGKIVIYSYLNRIRLMATGVLYATFSLLQIDEYSYSIDWVLVEIKVRKENRNH